MHVAIEAQSGRVAAPFGKVPSVPRRTPPEIVELIDKLLTKGKTVPEVQEYLQAKGYIVSTGPIYREADRLGIDLKGNPRRPGAGRPRKGAVPRESRTLRLDPAVWARVEAKMEPDESLNDAVERLLRCVTN